MCNDPRVWVTERGRSQQRRLSHIYYIYISRREKLTAAHWRRANFRFRIDFRGIAAARLSVCSTRIIQSGSPPCCNTHARARERERAGEAISFIGLMRMHRRWLRKSQRALVPGDRFLAKDERGAGEGYEGTLVVSWWRMSLLGERRKNCIGLAVMIKLRVILHAGCIIRSLVGIISWCQKNYSAIKRTTFFFLFLTFYKKKGLDKCLITKKNDKFSTIKEVPMNWYIRNDGFELMYFMFFESLRPIPHINNSE